MPAEDTATTRMVRREIVRRHIDDTALQVNAMHGVVYLRGQVKPLLGQECDLKAEMLIIQRILRSRPGVREVVLEVEFPKERKV